MAKLFMIPSQLLDSQVDTFHLFPKPNHEQRRLCSQAERPKINRSEIHVSTQGSRVPEMTMSLHAALSVVGVGSERIMAIGVGRTPPVPKKSRLPAPDLMSNSSVRPNFAIDGYRRAANCLTNLATYSN